LLDLCVMFVCGAELCRSRSSLCAFRCQHPGALLYSL